MADTKLFEQFPPVATSQWEQVIQKDLKGADYAKKLLWRTEEGITVKPYYRAEDTDGLPWLGTAPGEFPYVRGSRAEAGWAIREQIDKTNPAEANSLALKALAEGAEEIQFSEPAVGGAGEFAQLTAGLDHVALHFEGSPELYRLAVASGRAAGSVAHDPNGDPEFAAELLAAASPGFVTAVVPAYRFGDRGATVVQQLAYSLSAGVEYLAAMTGRGISAGRANRALAFTFPTGSNYFFEIARLRAARLLWARILTAFGLPQEEARGTFWCRTSWWNKTIYDPYVNLLRTTTEAMSAALGGAAALTVLPFDSTCHPASEFSRRLARNAQIILKQEAWFDRVADPAGGSWYVEKLTESIALEAWKLFQATEERGGYAANREAIREAVERSRLAREAAVASRRHVLLGTNQYPNPNERMLDEIDLAVTHGRPRRGAEVFEEIRLGTERHRTPPLFLLAEAGDLKMRQARSGFIANFFGCAGFTIDARPFDTPAGIVEAVLSMHPAAVVLCTSDGEYLALAAAVIEGLKSAGNKTPVLVAGLPSDTAARLTALGVADFIHLRTNAAEALTRWQTQLGIRG